MNIKAAKEPSSAFELPLSERAKAQQVCWKTFVDALPERRRVWMRGDVSFTTLRTWNSLARAQQIGTMKALKVNSRQVFVNTVAVELSRFVRAQYGPIERLVITNVPSGHSKTPTSFAATVALMVAHKTQATYVKLWRDRPRTGSSYPRPASERTPLEWIVMPREPVLIIDDVATSGSHMEECLKAIRQAGVPAFGLAWIGA